MEGFVQYKYMIGFSSEFKQKSWSLLLALQHHIVQFQLYLLCEFCII